MTRRRGAEERREATEPERVERGASWLGALIGMLTALGTALLLSGIIGGFVVLVVAALSGGGGTETAAGIASIVGVLATLFLSYLVGGYAAGRVASRQGTKHGLLAALLGVIVTVLLATIGAFVGIGISDNLNGVVLPDLPAGNGLGSLLAISAVSGILVLILPFVGGALGGAWGARTGRRRP